MTENTTTAEVADADLEALREQLRGEALVRGDSDWDAARQAWNLLAQQEPALVVMAETADDVAATVRFARAQGLRVAPQGTGHGAATIAGLGDAILLRTSRMTAVMVDADACTATVGAGAKWDDVVGPAAEHGLAALHGSSGTVGVAGYVLGGGLGWLGRSHGFACNGVRGLEVVTADGEIRRIDSESDPDLFWALRGGAGTPAIVTSLELGLVELREAYAGSLFWPIERAGDVARAWREWTTDLPDELSTTIKLIRFPPFPEIPDPLRGRALTMVTLAFAGEGAAGEALLAPMRALGAPYLDTVAPVPAPALAKLAGDPEDPVPGRGAGLLLDDLDEAAIDAYVGLAGPDADFPMIFLELRHLGGALERSSEAHGARDVAGAGYLLYGVGAAVSPEVDAAIVATIGRIEERMARWAAECSLPSFAEQVSDLRGCHPAPVAERLERIKADRDRDGLILANRADA